MRLLTLFIFSCFAICPAVLRAQTIDGAGSGATQSATGPATAGSVDTIGKNEQGRQMEEVSVTSLTPTQKAARQSYNITAIDATKLYNTTLDISHALDRVSGVRVREEGGVGSRFSFSLNGFTGRQVRFFLDGVPMDNFGSSFQINNIPINLAERVEVYKGVVPIWLGSDALGGAVNIVTSTKARTYLDASYSFGSFNTHRTAINAGYTAKSGFTLQLNAFQNYSDNNYWVHVDAADINTGEYFKDQRLRRFNDRYRNETAIANVGVVGKSWADQLLVGITLGQNYREQQTGARLVTVYGDIHRRGNIVMPSLRYTKTDLLVKGLDLRVTANYNLGEETRVDTVPRRYNWFQQYTQASRGGEDNGQLYTYRNNNGLGTANLSYQLDEKHSFMLNHVVNLFNRVGHDVLNPADARHEQPQYFVKNVTGLGYKFDYSRRWSTSVFLKQYAHTTRFAESYTPSGYGNGLAYREVQNNFNATGYGIATTYFITPRVQAKASYEHSYRLPDTDEVFGDLENLVGNPALQPERSDNINVGISAPLRVATDHRFVFTANALHRNVRDFIRLAPADQNRKLTTENRDRVTNLAFDGEVRYAYRGLLTAGLNVTYQNLRNQTQFEPDQKGPSILYQDRMPNMPFLFGNADASIAFRDFPRKGHTVSAGYNLLYVHAMYLYWPSLGSASGKHGIPMQLSHDANLVWTTPGGRYNVALECRNMLDARLYDNFSLQKPGRAFNIKLRYFIQKLNS